MDEWDELLSKLDLDNLEVTLVLENEPDFKWEYAHESSSENNSIFKNISPNVD